MKKYIFAISGGVDSMSMLHMAMNKRGKFKDLKKEDILVVTFDHNTRNGKSKDDAKFVRDYCIKNGIDCIIQKLGDFSSKKNSNFEAQARKQRYEWLRKYKDEYGAKYIVLAHHKDDLIETILMKLIRGTFIKGLIGFEEYSDDLWRPLIDLDKEYLYSYSKANNIPWREDETNKDNSYFRNSLRNILVPVLKETIIDLNDKKLDIRNYAIRMKEKLDDISLDIHEEMKDDGLDFADWEELDQMQKFWVISSLPVWDYEEMEIQTKKLEDIIRRIDTMQNGKKVLLGHKSYPIFKKNNKLFLDVREDT